MAKIIAVTNQKGGVGKTSTASALASGLAEKGYHVLAIDLDPQGNLGFCLGAEIENSPTVYELMKGSNSIEEVIQSKNGIDVIPSNILLSSAELEFSAIGREYLLKNGIAPVVGKYDFIVIDTPPALNVLTVNAYTATDNLIIPMVPEILSLLGISQLSETIELVRKYYNPGIEVLGILLNKYDKRRILTRDVSEMAQIIAKELGTIVFDTKIRSSVAVAEAPAHGESIYRYAANSNSTYDYRGFINELLARKEMTGDGKKTNKTEQVLKMISKEDDPENTDEAEMAGENPEVPNADAGPKDSNKDKIEDPEEEPVKAPTHKSGKINGETLLVNVAEQLVKENIREVMVRMNVCTCQICTNDIAALALNILPQKYITTNTGKQFTQMDIYKKQYETDVLAALTKACVRVKAGPRHGR